MQQSKKINLNFLNKNIKLMNWESPPAIQELMLPLSFCSKREF